MAFRRKAVLLVSLALLINFIFFLFSIWPYKGLEKLDPIQKPGDPEVSIEHQINQEIYKTNLTTYISLNVASLVLGMSASVLLKRKSA
ncbi:hypothetical protein [Phosphitispora fastidiosa]|uniref:hypothetical protein n=1 Tax=Phosphitispora fastidiosa TaxID=2837202 RepID=UPI001E40C51F|nr:hypothetical protein [Phosphitispora fastidiosa]MBU7005745.1 hypothetical protein [Phosphitispora fastidiosa]